MKTTTWLALFGVVGVSALLLKSCRPVGRHQRLRALCAPVPLRVDVHSPNTTGRMIIVGDVHGCLAELELLLASLNFTSQDTLLLVGDLVGKGPLSIEVVEQAMKIGAMAVLGNHDWTVLRWYAYEHGEGPYPIYSNPDGPHRQLALQLTAPQHAYLAQLPHIINLPQYHTIVVHAGLVPGVALKDQNPYDVLHMRNLHNGDPSEVGEGVPWPSQWQGPERVVFGHDARRGLQQYPFAIGIDTGCVYGKELTAYVLPACSLHHVPAQRQYCAPHSG
eukprot:NODE_3693_length_918_cov_27.925411_g3541_i0.p1 GENE.NODE_3693_length_918_cov_27.925411_g3541_i0~~NODE_3693_length_918_cov_27.925411_g3541_i0.p1  ORF type:complete len:289 (+),score=39.58 NODE_3693_length_918_cov_27.925411_g3541_i0:41-868(+)